MLSVFALQRSHEKMVYVQNSFAVGSTSSSVSRDSSLFSDKIANALGAEKYADALSELQMRFWVTFGVCCGKEQSASGICHRFFAFDYET